MRFIRWIQADDAPFVQFLVVQFAVKFSLLVKYQFQLVLIVTAVYRADEFSSDFLRRIIQQAVEDKLTGSHV